jgi:hypothetical protein
MLQQMKGDASKREEQIVYQPRGYAEYQIPDGHPAVHNADGTWTEWAVELTCKNRNTMAAL